VITPNKLNPTYVRAVVKGAPEYVLPLCTSKVDETGDNVFLGSEERRELLEEIIVRDMAKA
jgi:magnesium-transporting ATPase (P-type)